MADVLVVSGTRTGKEASLDDIKTVRDNSTLPIVIGSGATPENVHKIYDHIDGMIVGSCFKKDGCGNNEVERARVETFMNAIKKCA